MYMYTYKMKADILSDNYYDQFVIIVRISCV